MPGIQAPLLERERELERLSELLNEAAGGRGSLLLVGAEAGAGKTSLVHAFRERARERAPVLIGACDPLSTPQPLGPLLDIVHQAGPDLQRLVAGASSSPLDLYRTVLAWLDGRRQPVVIVFEDLHWADEATLDLLRFLGRRIASSGTLLIATYRNDEVGPHHPLRVTIGDLVTTQAMQRIRLEPLSMDAVRVLASDSDLDPAELHRQTGGNPFFVTEVIASRGQGVPPTVRDAVLARAARVSPVAREALDAAAVIGARSERWLLASLLGDSETAIGECVEAGVLVEQGDDLGFRHEIIRDALLEAIPLSAQRTLHATILAELQGRSSDPTFLPRLVHHAEAAGDHRAILEYAPQAARLAADLHSHREAAAQYQRAVRLDAHLPPVERGALLDQYAQECYLTDQMSEAIAARRQAIEIWRATGNHLSEGESLRRLARVLVLAGHNTEGEEASRQSIMVLESQPPSVALAGAYQTQAHLRMLNRDNAEAIERGLQAIELAERLGAEEARIYAYNTVGSAMLLSGIDDGIQYLEKSANLAQAQGIVAYVSSAYGNLGTAAGEMYRFRLADQYLSKGIAYAQEHDLDFERLYMLSWQALSDLYQARWMDASSHAGEVLRFPRAAAISRIMALLALGRIRARRGDPDVWEALDEALELATPTATLQRLAPVHAARAEAAWLAGNQEQTQAEARAVFNLAAQHKHPWHVGELGYWRWKAGDIDEPPAFAAEPYALQISGKWKAAAEAWEKLLCPYEAARARAESGNRQAMHAALETFEWLGARPMAAKTAQRLRNLGARSIPRGPRRGTRQNPAGLTARQLEVCLLLIEGLENREIAERLFISPKTVEHHVSAVLAKLEARTRAEAATKAARLGLTSQYRGSALTK